MWTAEELRSPSGDDRAFSLVIVVGRRHADRPNVRVEDGRPEKLQNRDVVLVCGRIEVGMLSNLSHAEVARSRLVGRLERIFAESDEKFLNFNAIRAVSGWQNVTVGD